MKRDIILNRTLLGVIAAVAVLTGTAWTWYNRDTSVYAPGFSEAAFHQIKVGMSEQSLYKLLGPPLLSTTVDFPETWSYSEHSATRGWMTTVVNLESESEWVAFDDTGSVIEISGKGPKGRIEPGMTKENVLTLIGEPKKRHPRVTKLFHYSKPSNFGRYRARIVSINNKGQVSGISTYDMHD